eukprot:340644-Prymnesium_polylepis.1
MIQGLITSDPFSQTIAAVLCVGLVMVLNFSVEPYVKQRYDTFECLVSTTEVVLMLLGCLVAQRTREEQEAGVVDETDTSLEVTALVCLIPALLVGTYCVAEDVRQYMLLRTAGFLREKKRVNVSSGIFDINRTLVSWLQQEASEQLTEFHHLEPKLVKAKKVYGAAVATAKREKYARQLRAEPNLVDWLLQEHRRGAHGPLTGYVAALVDDDRRVEKGELARRNATTVFNSKAEPALALWLSEAAHAEDRKRVYALLKELDDYRALLPPTMSARLYRLLRNLVDSILSRGSGAVEQLRLGTGATVTSENRLAKLLNSGAILHHKKEELMRQNEYENILTDLLNELNCEAVILIPAPHSDLEKRQRRVECRPPPRVQLPRLVVLDDNLQRSDKKTEKMQKRHQEITDWSCAQDSPAGQCMIEKQPLKVDDSMLDLRFRKM